MKELKRDPVKYIRDKAKARYEKGTECYICGKETELDFHHYYSLSPLLYKWVEEVGYDLQDIKLHSIYGRNPTLHSAPKQQRWVEIQRGKHGLV